MKKRNLYKEYTELAKYYDLIYSSKDYKKEAGKVKGLIKKYKKSKGKALLEVACGTGKHAQYLKKDFSILATDASREMLTIARKNVKGVTFRQANMVNLNLKKEFDVIICLFSSIGYVKTYTNLRKTLANFARYLKKGGVVIIEPWLTKDVFKVGTPHMVIYNGKDIKIARLNTSKVRGNVSILEMHYLAAEKNKEVKYFVDMHELGMFDIDKMLEMMRDVGLKSRFLKDGLVKGRGLLVGVKS